MRKAFKFILLFAWIGRISSVTFAQQQDIKLADEYFQQNQYEKAKAIYQKLAKEEAIAGQIHKKYLQTLNYLREWSEAEKFLKKRIKANPDVITYKAEAGLLAEQQNKQNEASKIFDKAIDEVKNSNPKINELAQFFIENNKLEWAEKLYREGRKNSNDKTAYAFQLAQLYKMTNNTEMMLEEYLVVSLENRDNIIFVQNALQDALTSPEDFEKLEKVLLSKVQKEPNETVYSDLLIWYYIQQKEFHKAFLQARSIDKRFKLEGFKLIEVGQISLQNKDFKSASEIFDYLVKEYPQSPNYPINRRYLINAKEELVKNTYPVNPTEIQSLIGEYQSLIEQLGKNTKTVEALRNMALLYGFYLNKKDSATALLQEAITINRQDPRFVAKCKLDLGDIYLLKGEPWEATLLYSQVEKSDKEQPLGYEAKLKNAKLSYYKGEFDLAQGHLDILKLATSREIANDAMDLSILIQDNIGLDSTGEAMREYAAIDLLLFQNQDQEALQKLDQLLKKYPGHSITDEVLWQKGQIYIKQNENQKAIEQLEKIVNEYGSDILGDDAYFLMAKLIEEKLGQKEKAMELYKTLLTKYPGSIYVVEARKRFRQLRGDAPN
jgi:tetratricopeptide (TPR) repeat protein